MVIGPRPTGYPSPQTGWQQQLPPIPNATQNGFDPRFVNNYYPSQLGQLAQGVVPQPADWALSSLLFSGQQPYGGQPSYGQPSYGQPSYGQPSYGGGAPNTSWYGMLPNIPNPTANGFSPYPAQGQLPSYLLQSALGSIPLAAQWALQSLQFGAGGYQPQQPSYGYPPQQPSYGYQPQPQIPYGYPPSQPGGNTTIPYVRSVQYAPSGLVPGQNGTFQGVGPDAGIFGQNKGQQLVYGQNNIPVGPGRNIQANVTPTFHLKQSSFLPNGTRGIHTTQNINTNLRYNPGG